MRLFIAAMAVSTMACGGAAKPVVPATPTPPVGECAELDAGGVVSGKPSMDRADRDLDGDGRAEVVTTDRSMCRGPDRKNCYWNVFVADGACHRYVGTIDGAAIEVGPPGDRGFVELRSWWRLSGQGRALLHVYQFGGAGYRLSETLVCRSGEGDQLQCASDDAL